MNQLKEIKKKKFKIKDYCEICCCVNKRLTIDHCHKTGEFRGTLCFTCNQGIGFLGDNIEMLENAIRYLKKEFPKEREP